MAVGEACEARSGVFLVRFDGLSVFLVCGWLREDRMELFSSCLDVWDVGEEFPDDVGEVGGDEQMVNFGMSRVPGEECRCPVCFLVVQRAVVFLGSAEVSLEHG